MVVDCDYKYSNHVGEIQYSLQWPPDIALQVIHQWLRYRQLTVDLFNQILRMIHNQ